MACTGAHSASMVLGTEISSGMDDDSRWSMTVDSRTFSGVTGKKGCYFLGNVIAARMMQAGTS